MAALSLPLAVHREPKEHRFINDSAISQMFDHDTLEKRRRDPTVPNAFRIDHHDRPARANPETRRLSTLHAPGTEQKPLALQQRRKQAIELTATPVR